MAVYHSIDVLLGLFGFVGTSWIVLCLVQYWTPIFEETQASYRAGIHPQRRAQLLGLIALTVFMWIVAYAICIRNLFASWELYALTVGKLAIGEGGIGKVMYGLLSTAFPYSFLLLLVFLGVGGFCFTIRFCYQNRVELGDISMIAWYNEQHYRAITDLEAQSSGPLEESRYERVGTGDMQRRASPLSTSAEASTHPNNSTSRNITTAAAVDSDGDTANPTPPSTLPSTSSIERPLSVRSTFKKAAGRYRPFLKGNFASDGDDECLVDPCRKARQNRERRLRVRRDHQSPVNTAFESVQCAYTEYLMVLEDWRNNSAFQYSAHPSASADESESEQCPRGKQEHGKKNAGEKLFLPGTEPSKAASGKEAAQEDTVSTTTISDDEDLSVPELVPRNTPYFFRKSHKAFDFWETCLESDTGSRDGEI